MKYPKTPIELSDSNLGITIGKFPLVIVDCYANWFSPCKKLESTIDEMAKSHAGKIVFGKINVNVNRVTANRFDIMNIPTLLIFEEGKLVDNIIGVVPRKEIENRLKPYLSGHS